MNETFMKERPVLPLILSMSLPMVISMLVNSLYNIVDSFFVAKISEDAMTALSLVYPVQNSINALSIGFGAVSYTHLDVYKRQISPICMEKKFFKNFMLKQMAYAAGEWPALPLMKMILYWQWELFIDFPFYKLKGCLLLL